MAVLSQIRPQAALPGGQLTLVGEDLGPASSVPTVEIGGVPALVTLSRPGRTMVRVPEGALPGGVVLTRDGRESNALRAAIAVPMAENLHPVANPAVDRDGNVYTTLSGSRGQAMPVSIFRISPAPEGLTHEMRPLVRDILNPTGLAFGPDGLLYVSSRADGTILRVGRTGLVSQYAEGLGIATGIAFDGNGDLYVGDRSGTIFKIRVAIDAAGRESTDTFVFATLEPSISAYHLAFDSQGTLYVTGPTPSSNQSIHAIDRDGNARVFYRGLGRAQGLAFDGEDNLYVAASLHGERGIVRITPAGEASLVVSGSNLVGLCFLRDGRVALATRDAVYSVALSPS